MVVPSLQLLGIDQFSSSQVTGSSVLGTTPSGDPFPLLGDPFPLLGDPFPLLGDGGDPFPLLGDAGCVVLGSAGGGETRSSVTLNVDLR